MGGILSGPEIRRLVELGDIKIDKYDPKFVNPASVDLRLGSKLSSYAARYLDAKLDNIADAFEIPEEGFVLQPGLLYLGHTLERVCTHRFVSEVDGKSSIGRLGICVHLTAGYIDPGFDGQITLEITAVQPVRIYAGMRFCQLRYTTIYGEPEQYVGNYTGDLATGPVPSRSWRQFDADR